MCQWVSTTTDCVSQAPSAAAAAAAATPSNKLAPLHHRLCTSEPGRLRLNREIQGEEQASLPSIWRILNVWKIKKDLTRIGLQCAPSKLHPVLRITWQDLKDSMTIIVTYVEESPRSIPSGSVTIKWNLIMFPSFIRPSMKLVYGIIYHSLFK